MDRDIYKALGGTKAGRHLKGEIANEFMGWRYHPDEPNRFPDSPTNVSKALRFVDAVAEALYTGIPNVSSVTPSGKWAYRQLKERLPLIVRSAS